MSRKLKFCYYMFFIFFLSSNSFTREVVPPGTDNFEISGKSEVIPDSTSIPFTNNKEISDELLAAMQTYKVPVVGYAIIKDYQIVTADTVSIDPKISVNRKSIFQAASLSKMVAAYGALRLVSENKIKLDDPVNNLLKKWKIPDNYFTKDHPVTLRELLNMTSGLSVNKFYGYPQWNQLPSLTEILDGKQPATNAPIRVTYQPGTKYSYSGGGFVVLQQLIEEMTRVNFGDWAEQTVLTPLDMNQSIFQFPLNDKLHGLAVPGYLSDGQMVQDGWENYPAIAASGLWSTPTDIAKLIIDMSKSIFEDDKSLVTPALGEEMLKRDKNTSYGLGVVVNGTGDRLNFRKSGHNTGYRHQVIMFPETGDGMVIMTNSENGDFLINYIIPIIARRNNWPCYFPYFDEQVEIPEFSC